MQPVSIKHVEKIGVAAGVELISALHFHATFPEKIDQGAMKHGRAELRFDVVADERQIFFLEALHPDRIAGDEDTGMLLTNARPASSAQPT